MKAGTVLKGLGYIRGQEPPVAKEDGEYPEWLWGLLDEMKGEGGKGEGEGDAFGELHWFLGMSVSRRATVGEDCVAHVLLKCSE